MTRSPITESRPAAAGGARPVASASHEYHLDRPQLLDRGGIADAAPLSPTQMDPREVKALQQWQNALRSLRRALAGHRR